MTSNASAQLIDRTVSLLQTLPVDRLQRVYELVAAMAGGKLGIAAAPTLDQLAVLQGVDLNTRIGELGFNFWPDDDSVDEFVAMRRAQRKTTAMQTQAQLDRLPQ